MSIGALFTRLVDLLPEPSRRAQSVIAALVVLSQGLIAVTGAIVRVTASGLGCPTWPQCFPGSFVPVAHAEVPRIHQAIEFGNRMVTFLVVATAIAHQTMRIVEQNKWIVVAPNVAAIAYGVVTVMNPIVGVVINNGVALVAAINSLRPLRTASDKPPQHWKN